MEKKYVIVNRDDHSELRTPDQFDSKQKANDWRANELHPDYRSLYVPVLLSTHEKAVKLKTSQNENKN